MTDVTKAIAPKSDQLNADDLITGPRTIRVREVKVHDTPEQPIWVYFDNDNNRPWKPCKTSSRVLAGMWGANSKSWVGKSCTLYNDPSVTWGGAQVGGIRVSHVEGIDKPTTLQLTKAKGKRSAVTIMPLILSASGEVAPIDEDAIKASAMNAARKGKAAFSDWWKANPNGRDIVKPIMADIQEATAKADESNDEGI
jgi:hypothetical protein